MVKKSEFDINKYLLANKIEYISMNNRENCGVDLEENILPSDNYKNLQNFIISY